MNLARRTIYTFLFNIPQSVAALTMRSSKGVNHKMKHSGYLREMKKKMKLRGNEKEKYGSLRTQSSPRLSTIKKKKNSLHGAQGCVYRMQESGQALGTAARRMRRDASILKLRTRYSLRRLTN